MTGALQQLRDQLTTSKRSGVAGFRSIVAQCDSSSEPEPVAICRAGRQVKLSMGVVPGPPADVRAFAFEEEAGTLLGKLEVAQIIFRQTEIFGGFQLPQHLRARRVSLVIKGQWPGGEVAGCEMSFRVDPLEASGRRQDRQLSRVVA